MKIQRAIEILSDSANRGVTTFNEEFKDAEKLGIEALKRIKYLRDKLGLLGAFSLEGETEE